jgi:hypothetical protein
METKRKPLKLKEGSSFLEQVVAKSSSPMINLILERRELGKKEKELEEKEEKYRERNSFNPGPLLHYVKSKVEGAVLKVDIAQVNNIWGRGTIFIEVKDVEFDSDSALGSLVYTGRMILFSTEQATPKLEYRPDNRVVISLENFVNMSELNDPTQSFTILYHGEEEERNILSCLNSQDTLIKNISNTITPKRKK